MALLLVSQHRAGIAGRLTGAASGPSATRGPRAPLLSLSVSCCLSLVALSVCFLLLFDGLNSPAALSWAALGQKRQRDGQLTRDPTNPLVLLGSRAGRQAPVPANDTYRNMTDVPLDLGSVHTCPFLHFSHFACLAPPPGNLAVMTLESICRSYSTLIDTHSYPLQKTHVSMKY